MPHLQLSPHAQPAAWLFALALRQPQLQAAPAQDAQLHGFELVNILSSLEFLADLTSTTEVSHWNPGPGLNEAAIVQESIGYHAGACRLCAEGRSLGTSKGEGSRANSPRISTEGAIPTIW